MKLTLPILTIVLILTGCSSNTPKPKIKPVTYKTHKLKKCGMFKYENKNGNIILDYKVAKCLKYNMITCCKDKKNLEVANEANIEIIKTLTK